MNIFIIVFEDNSIFEGGVDYNDTKWLQIPDKKIRSIFYKIPQGDHLVLSNYEVYFHMVEVLYDVTGKDAGKVKIESVSLLAKQGNNVRIYKIKDNKIEIIDSKYEGDLLKLNPQGWKGGY